jgi:hypothetical protein
MDLKQRRCDDVNSITFTQDRGECQKTLIVLWTDKNNSSLCHYSVGGAWWHLGVYESFKYPMRVISPATGGGVEN